MFKFFKKKENKKNCNNKEPEQLLENKHFYIENGSYVFTAFYLKNRGYCCGNGCRHCPYKEEKNKP